jgi:hypothetical protein
MGGRSGGSGCRGSRCRRPGTGDRSRCGAADAERFCPGVGCARDGRIGAGRRTRNACCEAACGGFGEYAGRNGRRAHRADKRAEPDDTRRARDGTRHAGISQTFCAEESASTNGIRGHWSRCGRAHGSEDPGLPPGGCASVCARQGARAVSGGGTSSGRRGSGEHAGFAAPRVAEGSGGDVRSRRRRLCRGVVPAAPVRADVDVRPARAGFNRVAAADSAARHA